MRRFILTAFALLAMAVSAFAQTVTINETFTGTTLSPGWSVGGTGYTPILTAPTIDTAGNGWLRLTSNGTNQATYAVDSNAFASKNATISAKFDIANYNGTGADGITFFLADASKTFGVGAYGGSLGYAQKNDGSNINGMSGGYIGIGIDEFGNFSNGTEGRIGGVGFTPNSIAVRGPGSGMTGYDYLGGTGDLGANAFSFSSSTTRPTGNDSRSIQVTISATNQMTVYMSSGGGPYVELYNIDVSGYTRPDQLVLGFTGSTGSQTDIHEVRNVNLSSVTASIWTAAGANGLWGTGNNWVGNTIPANFTDVLLDNSYASTAQSIDLGGGTRTVRSLMIDAPFAYSLNNGTIAFNSNGVLGPSGIFVSSTHGNANQTINANMTAANAVEFKNDSTGTLGLNGTLNNGGKAVTVSGAGDTTFTGVISGAGSLTKNGTGNATLSAANTYSGGTTLNTGTLTANNNSALGSGAVAINGGTLASTTGANLSNAVNFRGNAGLSGVTLSGQVTQTNGSYTVGMSNTTITGNVALSNTSTGQTLTAQVNSGTSTISGVISNGGTGAGGLTKDGNGTLVLGNVNTYTGSTTINAGTIQLGTNNAISDVSAVNINSGTLDLNGFSDKVGALSFTYGSVLNFDNTAGTNSFVFGAAGAYSGVLTINNYTAGSNYLGSTASGLSTSFLNSLYFSGIGAGATEAGSLSNAGNSLGNAYKLTPNAVTWNVWKSNSSTAWTTNGNWASGNDPDGASTYAEFGTGTQGSVVLGSNRTVGAIKFSATGPVAYNISGAGRTLTFDNGNSPAYIQQQSANTSTISVTNIALNENLVADVTGAGNLVVSSAISGSGYGITKAGNGGKLILSGNNTFNGGVLVSTGVVQGQSNTAFGSNWLAVNTGAAAELAGGITANNAIYLSGSGVSNGGALRNVSGNNTASGAVSLLSGTRINSDSGTLTLSGGISGAEDLSLGGAGNITVSSVIGTGTGGVTIDGAGTKTFSGAGSNTYTGVTTVNEGSLNLSKTGGATAIGTGGLVINGGTVTETVSNQISTTDGVTVNGGTFALGASTTQSLSNIQTEAGSTVSLATGSRLTVNSGEASNFGGVITGAGALTVDGSGTTYLLGNNSYSGGTTANASVRVNNSNSFGTGAVTVNAGGNVQLQNGVTVANAMTLNGSGTAANNGAIENFAGNNTVSGAITLGSATKVQSSAGNLAVTGNITGNYGLTMGGAGNISASGVINNGSAGLTKVGSGNLTFSGANTFTGQLAINGGSVTLGANNTLANSLAVSIASGSTFAVNGKTDTIGKISGAGAVDFGAGALTLTGASSFGGSFTGDGSLTLGTGSSLALTSAINDSALDLTLSGGTLSLGALGNTLGKLTITGNSIIDFGGSLATSLTLADFEIAAGVTLTITNWVDGADYFFMQNWTGNTYDTRGSSPSNQVVFTGFSGNSTGWHRIDDQTSPVPEPASYGVFMMGILLAFYGVRSYRRRKADRKATEGNNAPLQAPSAS